MTDIPWDKLTVAAILGLALAAVVTGFMREWVVAGKTHRSRMRSYEKQLDRVLTLFEQNMDLAERNQELMEELQEQRNKGAM